jgi:NAD(P)-dependent dehydrogenase (short-subunit alcohol dehydrogenase family)
VTRRPFAARDRFGRLDARVNNAGNVNAAFFEDLIPKDFRAQVESTFFGPVNVTRRSASGHAWPPFRRARRRTRDASVGRPARSRP